MSSFLHPQSLLQLLLVSTSSFFWKVLLCLVSPPTSTHSSECPSSSFFTSIIWSSSPSGQTRSQVRCQLLRRSRLSSSLLPPWQACCCGASKFPSLPRPLSSPWQAGVTRTCLTSYEQSEFSQLVAKLKIAHNFPMDLNRENPHCTSSLFHPKSKTKLPDQSFSNLTWTFSCQFFFKILHLKNHWLDDVTWLLWTNFMKDRRGECMGKISHPYRVWKVSKQRFSENTELAIGRTSTYRWMRPDVFANRPGGRVMISLLEDTWKMA